MPASKPDRLDILIIEQRPGTSDAAVPDALAGLPDGLDNLAANNLLTCKNRRLG